MAGRKKKPRADDRRIWLLYIALVVAVLAYAHWNNVLIGLAAFVLIVIIIYVELRTSVRTEGLRNSVYDIVIALVAVAVVWIILIALLQTNAPIDAVSSCSMLPALQRGDVVVLHGLTNMSRFLSSSHVPVVNVSTAQMNSMLSNMSGEWLAYYAYYNGNRSLIDTALRGNNYTIGLYNYNCLSTYQYLGEPGRYATCYVGSGQQYNLIRYNYSIANVSYGNVTEREVITQQISIANVIINENYSNPIVVYATTPQDMFPKEDIIHRVFAAIRAGNSYYLLTKGDNNPGLDIQFGNYPAAQNATVGYVVAAAPVLGYLKLILYGELSAPQGCNFTIER